MQVITEVGLGTVDDWPENPDQVVVVKLNHPPQKGKVVELGKGNLTRKFPRREVFPLTDYAVIRVINVTGLGIASNLLFYDSKTSARAVFDDPKPVNETRFLLNLKDLTFQLNYELGFGVENYLWLQPWLDRWGIERSGFLDRAELDRDEPSLEKFDIWREKTPGTTNGILASVFLDIPGKRVLRFCISVMAPRGVVYEAGLKKEGTKEP